MLLRSGASSTSCKGPKREQKRRMVPMSCGTDPLRHEPPQLEVERDRARRAALAAASEASPRSPMRWRIHRTLAAPFCGADTLLTASDVRNQADTKRQKLKCAERHRDFCGREMAGDDARPTQKKEPKTIM